MPITIESVSLAYNAKVVCGCMKGIVGKVDKIWMIDGQEMTEEQVVSAILQRDATITREFFFHQCYPLFNNIYNKYYTDCENVLEFMQEIYLYIIIPQRKTGLSKLAGFAHRCSFQMWLKIVAENYCHQLFAKRIETDNNYNDGDSLERIGGSVDKEIKNLSMEDAYKVLKQIPNNRYRRLIELRYLLDKTNEETAELLSMTMQNYYNKHKLAKAQLYVALRKEGIL